MSPSTIHARECAGVARSYKQPFRRVSEVRDGPLKLEVPDFSTVNLPALLLALVALVGVFRFKLGPMIVIPASCPLPSFPVRAEPPSRKQTGRAERILPRCL